MSILRWIGRMVGLLAGFVAGLMIAAFVIVPILYEVIEPITFRFPAPIRIGIGLLFVCLVAFIVDWIYCLIYNRIYKKRNRQE